MAIRKTRKTVEPIRGVSIETMRSGTQTLRIRISHKGKILSRNLNVLPTNDNIRAANRKVEEIRLAISLGTFDPAMLVEVRNPAEQLPTLGELHRERAERLLKTGYWEQSTYSDRQKLWRNNLSPFFENVTLPELTPELFKKWCKANQALSLSTVGSILSLLNPLVKEGLAEGVIQRHPYEHLDRTQYFKGTSVAERKEKIDPFTKEELARFFEACEHPVWRSFWQFMFFSGARLQEGAVIKWDNVDFVERTLVISEAVGFHEAPKNGKRPRWGASENEYLKGTKTDGSTRTLELNSVAWAALMDMRAVSQLQGKLIFPTESVAQRSDFQYPWFSRQMIRNNWRQTLVRAQLRKERRSPKQTRHTYASLSLMEGTPEIDVANALGHSTTAMVQKHYGKWIKSANRPRPEISFNADELLQAERRQF